MKIVVLWSACVYHHLLFVVTCLCLSVLLLLPIELSDYHGCCSGLVVADGCNDCCSHGRRLVNRSSVLSLGYLFVQ